MYEILAFTDVSTKGYGAIAYHNGRTVVLDFEHKDKVQVNEIWLCKVEEKIVGIKPLLVAIPIFCVGYLKTKEVKE